MKNTTQVYLEKNGCWLMLHRIKKENDMNEGKWIAAGGKFEPGETAEQCAAREVLEETGFAVKNLVKRAEVEFVNDIYENELMHVFTCSEFEKVTEPVSDEGVFEWVPVSEVFNLNLWEGDRAFLEKIVSGEDFFRMRLEYSGFELISVK